MPHFWRFRRPVPRRNHDDGAGWSQVWRDSGLAEEVEAYLAGRLVNHLTAGWQPVPAWAALNRLAHADRSGLVHLVAGESTGPTAHPLSGHASWAAAERFLAGYLLARARTAEQLQHVQRVALVPLELALIEQNKFERLTADEVLELGAEAVDSYHSDR